MTSFDEVVSPVDRRQMSLRGEAIRRLYAAAEDDYLHGGAWRRIRFSNTIAIAAIHLSQQDINDTINAARKED